MCVIAIVTDPNRRPSVEELCAMHDANNQGAGLAWRDKGLVKWEKGLGLQQVLEKIHHLPTPYVVHFRIASVGDALKRLTHPFPVTAQAQLDLAGQGKHQVLFHNGTWSEWRKFSLSMVAQTGGKVKIPLDKWSDSRAMAFLAHHFGLGILELIDEKIVCLGPGEDDLDIFGSGWSNFNGYIVSNKYFEHRLMVKVTDKRSQAAILLDGNIVKPKVDPEQIPPLREVKSTDPLQRPGGASTVIPFVEVYRAFKEKKTSKSQLKNHPEWRKAKFILSQYDAMIESIKAQEQLDLITSPAAQQTLH